MKLPTCYIQTYDFADPLDEIMPTKPPIFADKPYDGRYHTAKALYDAAWKVRSCRHCESDWFGFYAYKFVKCFEFQEENSRQIRRMDLNWDKGREFS